MTRNAYVDLCLSLQALRRHHEGIQTPLAPALGVAGSVYTHQVANTLRVLTDVRVRHLLADEVGLGKTVQALMILNALRNQRPDIRALVIVPDRLVPQWRDEILTRAHTAPIGEEAADVEDQYIRLAWEAQLRMKEADGSTKWALGDIDPSRYDALVVDELHKLRTDVQDRVVRVAAEFEHLLVLTATPAFQNVKRHAQLFALLEPERTAIARWNMVATQANRGAGLSVRDDLSSWPDDATSAVVSAFIDRDQDAAARPPDGVDLSAVALSDCAYRRVIRTRRVDYSGVLPRRRHVPVVVEPLGAEADRQALMWRYFRFLGDLSRRFDPILLAKRVILSPPSLEQRVDFLRRKGHERDGLLERAKPLVHRGQGDSRLDALVDLLSAVWERDSTERVLVAAQDNLTVDYLFEMVRARLPIVGALGSRVPLEAALIRQGQTEEMLEDLGGHGNDTAVNLDAFQRGEALILFAPEKAQVGLNLQRARVLVLYSVPWRPEEVEQWIGRLDRIGNAAAFSNDGSAKTIDVYTIAQRGLVDEKVVTVLQRFHVFERSVNLDGDHLEEVARLIEDAALRPESISWHELEEETEKMAGEDEVQELNSALRAHLPWTVSWATGLRERLDQLPPTPPVLKELPEHSRTGPRSWDRAFEGMVKLLSRSGDYHIRWNTDPDGGRFRTLWYQFGERGMYGRRDVQSKVVFSFGADPGHERSPRHAYAFITRRGDIGTPPRRSVTMCLDQEEIRRPLRFLSFGDGLHDEVVRGWLPQSEDPILLDVTLFDDHALWEHGAPGMYLLRASILDPAAALLGRGVEDRTLEAVARAATRTAHEKLLDVVHPFSISMRSALEADVRWLRSEFAATFSLEVRRRARQQWVSAEEAEVRALLNPMAHARNGVPRAAELRVAEDERVATGEELNRLRASDPAAAKLAWSPKFPEFDRALAARLRVVQVEALDAVALAREELRDSEESVEGALERGNRAQITRAENVRDSAADALEMLTAFWEQRALWLRECGQEVRAMRPRETLTAALRVRRTG